VFIGKYDVQSAQIRFDELCLFDALYDVPSKCLSVNMMFNLACKRKMTVRVDGSYRAAKRMKIEGRKRKFVRIDGAPQKEDRRKRCNRARNVRCLVY
jgi:hypothetical protein